MLRRSKTDKAAAAAAAAAALDQPTGSGVLVVSDDESTGELLSRVVASKGAAAVRAHDADSAVRAIVTGEGIGSVVLDFSSGTAASFAVLEAIREERGEAMPAVLMIATTSANRTLAYDSGVDEFLTRPFHVDDFTTAVAAMMRRTPAERAERRQQESVADHGEQDVQDLQD